MDVAKTQLIIVNSQSSGKNASYLIFRHDRIDTTQGDATYRSRGCRGVESHAAFTGNHMYAWFDDDEALARWYSKQCDRFATSEHRTANSEQED